MEQKIIRYEIKWNLIWEGFAIRQIAVNDGNDERLFKVVY